jgi:hypothetical protein
VATGCDHQQLRLRFAPTRWLALWKPKDLPKSRDGHGLAPETIIKELQAADFVLEDQLDE